MCRASSYVTFVADAFSKPTFEALSEELLAVLESGCASEQLMILSVCMLKTSVDISTLQKVLLLISAW